MNSNQTLNLVDLLVSLFDPVIQSIENEAYAYALLKDLGYLPPSEVTFLKEFSDPLKSLATIIELKELEIEQNVDQDQFKTYVEILNGTTGIINGVNNVGPSITANFSNDFLSQTGIVDKLPKQLVDYLIISMLERRFPILHASLLTLGIIEHTYIEETPTIFNTPYLQRKFHWDKIGDAIADTIDHLKTTYAWESGDIAFYKLIRNLHWLGNTLNLDTEITNPFPDTLSGFNKGQDMVTAENAHRLDILRFPFLPFDPSIISLQLYPVLEPTAKEKVEGIGFGLFFNTAEGLEFEIAPRINLKVNYPEPQLDAGIVFKNGKDPELVNNVFGTGSQGSNVFLFEPEFIYKNRVDEKILVFDTAIGARLEFQSWSTRFGVKGNNAFFVEINLKKATLLIKTDGEDGFLNKILPPVDAKAEFDLTVGFSTSTGLYIDGSSSLEIRIPSHIEIGPVSIEGITIGIHPAAGKVPVSLSANIRAAIGPIVATVNNIGVLAKLSFDPNNNGNLGPVQMNIGFKAPTGVGLVVDAGGIKGGGILDFNPEKGEYFGALELEFQNLFSLKAFGIINTRMPDGSKNFSLLIIITAEFQPIQLGFGFTLNGVGGLLGVNRTARLDVLREGVKTNTLKSILFPEDVVANINRIVSDIRQVFPPQDDHFLICPMGKLGWGTPTIITLELGILIEIPATGFAILGVLKALLPEENNPLLKLQVNFLGVIDFENRFISFDASLFDSSILTFTLSGDMALRIGFGDKPMFLLSVGGFHPAFKEVPNDLKSMRRITISLYDSSDARIIIQTYFAITSNTAQFGAKAELFAKKGSFNIYGFVSYDVLFQFVPFKFIADFAAGVALRRNTSVIMSIRVSGQLSGPKPWDAKGEASVSFFFFSVSVPFHVTWGDANNQAAAILEDILALLQTAIDDNRNWKAEIPANSKLLVSIRSIPGSSMAVHPFGILTFSERLVPLEIEIKKFGNKLPKDATKFEINVDDDKLKTEVAREQFAPANFFEMKDSEKLSRPSFEAMKSGFKVTGSAELKAPPHIAQKSVDYEFSYLGQAKKPTPDKYIYPGLFFKAATKSAAVSQAVLSHQNNRVSLNAPAKIALKEEQYVLANVSDMKPFDRTMTAASYTEALQHYNELIILKPELRDQVQVLADYEININ